MIKVVLSEKITSALYSFQVCLSSAPYQMLLYVTSFDRKIIVEYSHTKIFIIAQMAFML